MPSKLILDPAEPGMAEVLKGLTPGQSVTLSDVEVTVDTNSEELFEATVNTISMEAGDDDEEETTEAEVAKEEIPPASNSASGGFDMGGRP